MSKPCVLYDKDQCPFCWRVRMSLRRLRREVEFRAHDDAAWRDVWPALTHFGTVPVMTEGELVLTDSRNILEYLDERFGGLWPRSPEARARAREILCYADGRLGPPARDLVFECRDHAPADRDQAKIDDAIRRWREALPVLEGQLGGSVWFADDCSIADYALATRFGLAFAHGMPMTGLPANVSVWLSRVFARDEVNSTAPGLVRDWLAEGHLPDSR